MSDYIPSNADLFHSFAEHLLNYVSVRISQSWTHIDAKRFSSLQKLFSMFESAWMIAKDSNSTANVRERQRTQKECDKALRSFVNQYLRFDPVTDKDRDEMKIPNKDTVRTAHTEVHEIVDFKILIKGTNNLTIDFKTLGSNTKAKPKGYSGAVIIWTISDVKPNNNDDYTGHTLATRSPYTIEFDDNDSGKSVWVKATWQNGRGILGRWSEAQTAIVP